MTLSYLSEVPTQEPAEDNPKTDSIEALRAAFAEREALENPDVVLPTKALRLTEAGILVVPELGGAFSFTEWSKKQLGSLVGVRWDRWFARMSAGEQAQEVNKRLWSSDQRLKVRTLRSGSPNGLGGTLTALVSPTFTPLPDTQVLDLLVEGLQPVESDLSVMWHAATDKTTTYVLRAGKPFRPGDDRDIGDIAGCLTIRNSGVGFAATVVMASLTRLICKNGMALPIPDPVLLRRAHRAFDIDKLRQLLGERLLGLPGKLANGGRVLVDAQRRPVADEIEAFVELLRNVRLPRKLLPVLECAYSAEPRLAGTAFGISQAVTRAAQDVNAEERFELERAAGEYLRQLE